MAIIVLEKCIEKVHFAQITDPVSFLTQIDALTLTKKIIVGVDKDVLIIMRFVDAAFRELKEKRELNWLLSRKELKIAMGYNMDIFSFNAFIKEV